MAMDTDTDVAVEADGDGETTRQNAQLDLPRAADPGARRPSRSRASRPTALKVEASEAQVHASVAQLLDWVLRPPAIYTTFPAGWGKLTKGTAGRLYACGLKRGIPDILIFPGKGRVVGIELKGPLGTPTSAQRAMHAQLMAAGVPVYVCRSTADVIRVLNREGVPFRYVHDK